MSFSKSSTGGGAGGAVSSLVVTQTAHGFTVPQVVYLDDSDSLYKLAKSDVLATANAIGVVTQINSVNTFSITCAGIEEVFTGLTEGETFYVSSTVAGGISNSEPNISRPVLNALSATKAYIFTDAIERERAGGNDTEVQWNNNGVLDGDPSFTYIEATKLVTMEDLVINNDLVVKGTTTSVNSETLNVGDNHILLNAGNTLLTSETGGMVVNTGVIGSVQTVAGAFVPGVASTSNPSVTLAGGTFATNDIVEVSGSIHNDGVYEVLSFATNVLTVRGIGNTPTVEDFVNNQFTTESAAGKVVKVNVTVLMANDDGDRKWGEATGSTTSIANPFEFDYFNEGNLPYVVGKAGGGTVYQYNTIQSAIDAVEADSAVDHVIAIMPGIYTENLTILTATGLNLTSLGAEPSSVVVTGDVSITAAPSSSIISMDGIRVVGAITTLGTTKLDLTLNRIQNVGTGSQVFAWGNTNSDSNLTCLHCTFIEAGSATAALERTAGTPAVTLIDCVIDGHLDFSGVNGGSIEAQNLVVFDGEIDLSNTTLVSRFINLTVRSIGTNAALDLTSTGGCIVIGGLIDVPGGGNAVTPATGANFTFANIATSSGTILDTDMGTRLATDGVTLKSDGSGGEDYLDDAGGYSVPKSIFNSDGVVTATRLVDIPSGRNLNFRAFNTATLPTATGEGQLVLKEDLLFMACKVLNGAGGTISIKEIRITPASMLVTDSSDEIGFVYAADYSANYTARSLVDKGYVDTTTVQSITGGTNINVSGTLTVPIVNLDAAITGVSVNGVTLTTAGSATDFLNATGAYSVPANIYNADGVTTGNRIVSIPSSSNLTLSAINTALLSTATKAGTLVVKDDAVSLAQAVMDGAGGETSTQKIVLDDTNGMVVTDSTNSTGLVYALDYSANYTVRSLVDKNYVDTSTVQSITGGTNINVTGTATVPVVNLDAAITGTSVNGVTLTTGGSATDFLNATGAYSAPASIFNSSGNISATRVVNAPLGRMLSFNAFDVNNFSDSGEEGFLQVVSSKVGVGYLDLDGAGGINGLSQITIDATGMVVTDSINNKGFEYSIDYSSNFTDRSIIDKGYADLGHLSRVESGAANLTSSGKPILAVTDSSAPRTVTIAASDVVEGNQFIVKDEDGNAGTNIITVTTPTISVTSVASGTSGSDFLTSTAHGYAVNQRVVHAGFSDGTYNGLFTVTAIVSTTRYEVAAITFVATDTGTSNIAIDGQASFTIGVNYGSLEFYCNDNQVFTKGGGNTALAVRSATTGLLEGGEMSIVGGLPSNTLDIGAATGQIVDQSSPGSPVLTSVSVEADASYTIANPTDGVFLIAIDVDSNVVELDLTTLTKEERHDHVIIGAYVATSGGGGGAVRILDEPVNVGYGISTALADFLADAIGPINMQGNTITGSVTDLSINTSAGTSYIVGQNYRVDPDCPNERSLPQATGFGFRRSFVDTGDVLGLESAGATFTEINPLMYNPTAGTVTAVANNNYTAQQVYLAPTGIYNVAYGQIQSTSESTIIDAVEDGTAFTEIAAFMDQVLIGIIVVQMTAGNLSTATFLQPEKFRMNVPA